MSYHGGGMITKDQLQEPKDLWSDGNAFAIMGKAIRAMRKANCTQEQIDKYQADATSGDYDNLIRVTMGLW